MSANNDNSDDNALFKAFVNDIKPLKTHTVDLTPKKPLARVKKHINIPPPISLKNTLKSSESNEFFSFHINKKMRKNFKAGHVIFDATLDLHGHTASQSERLLAQFINDCRFQTIRYAIIVHGQGHNSAHGSILKPAVLYWLSQQDIIDAYCPAQQRDGGNGASYIMLGSQT